MRKLAALLLSLTVALSLSGCAAEQSGDALSFEPNTQVLPAGEELEIWFVTDLHYLSPELTDCGEPFLRMLARGDGKMAHYSPEIAGALVDAAVREQPDALLLGGDLTFNGELLSHQELAGLLAQVEAAGVPVLVIPGNHDLNSQSAYRYEGDSAYPADTLTGAGFRQLYGSFGYADSLTHDDGSFSYAYELAEDLWLVAIDANSEENPGWVKDSTLKWLDETLTQAEEQGAAVITFTHQNTLRHNALFPFGYTIINNQSVQDVLLDHSVALNLSGHIHLQHVGTLDGFSEITTSSLAIVENHVGRVTVAEDRSGVYDTFSLDVAGYAAAQGWQDENLRNFAGYGWDYFVQNGFRGMEEELAGYGLTEEETRQMSETAREINGLYFTGRLARARGEVEASPGGQLWLAHFRQGSVSEYIEYLLAYSVKDENHLEIPSLRLEGRN